MLIIIFFSSSNIEKFVKIFFINKPEKRCHESVCEIKVFQHFIIIRFKNTLIWDIK